MIPSGSRFFVPGLGLLSAAVAAAALLFHSRLDEAALPFADDGQSTAVAFVCQYADKGGLFLTSGDGQTPFQLTDPPEPSVDVSPVWSPDLDSAADGYQGKIAFLRRPHPTCAEGSLYIVDPAGSDLQLVASLLWGRDPVPMDQTSGGIGSENTLAWSPNGRELVFAWHGGLWAVDDLDWHLPLPDRCSSRGGRHSHLGGKSADRLSLGR